MTAWMSALVLIVSELRRLRAEILDLRAEMIRLRGDDEPLARVTADDATQLRCRACVEVVERETEQGRTR